MKTFKRQLQSVVKRLPENCTAEDVMYHLYVLQKVRRGMEAIERGEVTSQDDVEREFKSWLNAK